MMQAALIVSCLSGFVALSDELVWVRIMSYASSDRPSAFGVLLSMYLLGIAIGAARAPAMFRRRDGSRTRLEFSHVSCFVSLTSAFNFLFIPALSHAATINGALMVMTLGIIVLAAMMQGALLPMLCQMAIPPDSRAGQRTAFVYCANIVGSCLGSLVTGLILFDCWSLKTIALVLVVTSTVAAILIALVSPRNNSRIVAFIMALLVLGACAAYSHHGYAQVYERLTFHLLYSSDQAFAQVIENRHGVIAVTQDKTLYSSGAFEGRINTDLQVNNNGIDRAYALAGLHKNPARVLMIGLGSGSWAQVVVNLPGVQHLKVIELNPAYTEVIKQHKEVASLLNNPKVEIVTDDGRRWLMRHSDEQFDLVVMNTMRHWRNHATNLLSEEFMRLVQAHLAPGGVFYYNTTSSLDAQKTGLSVFKYGLRIYSCIAASDAPLDFDWRLFESVLQNYRIDGEPVISQVDDKAQQQMFLIEENLRTRTMSQNELHDLLRDAQVVTDDNMRVEFIEPMEFF